MPDLNPDQREYIDVTWRNKWDSIIQNQNQVLNWIFAVHGGGIAGLLAFAASKGSSCSLVVGLTAFTVGLVLILVYGVCMFYFESHYFYRFRDEVKELHAGRIDWAEFIRRRNIDPDRYRTCELLAWLSGICGLVGVITAICAVL